MNPNLDLLQPYPFEKLAVLKKDYSPPSHLSPINLSIGEPQHPTPKSIINAMTRALPDLKKYPTTAGTLELRETISNWLVKRFQLSALDAKSQVLPVNGTREALFAFAQAMIDRRAKNPLILSPNPFYQIYEGAAFLAGAKPWFINSLAENNFQPNFVNVPENVWQDCQLIYICSPNNPTGTVLDTETLQDLIHKADKYDFIIASDECYSEIYADETNPPVGLLQACTAMGRTDYERCVVFNSLSKRSNAPGLRSGFVAGDADILKKFLLYRTYHGCAMSPATQIASIAAWQHETHVATNRNLYREKFKAVIDILSPILPVTSPEGAFYLWLNTPIADDEFAKGLFNQQHVTVLPGSYLSRVAHDINPGQNYVRIALVAELEECMVAAERIVKFL